MADFIPSPHFSDMLVLFEWHVNQNNRHWGTGILHLTGKSLLHDVETGVRCGWSETNDGTWLFHANAMNLRRYVRQILQTEH
jgi:hypothetical protein